MLDPMIRDKLNLLNKKKQQLVEVEDFDKAKDLKLIIDKIKVIGAQIAKMEFQK
jgi:protein-arginine kinase activator protein McsA